MDESSWTMTQGCGVSAAKYQLMSRKNKKLSAIMHFAAGPLDCGRQFNCQTWSESLLIQQVYQGLNPYFQHEIWQRDFYLEDNEKTTFLTGAVNLTLHCLPAISPVFFLWMR